MRFIRLIACRLNRFEKRIEIVHEECGVRLTRGAEIFFDAAMAQNGTGFTTKNVKEIFIRNNGFLNHDGSINWNAYILSREPKTENWYRRLLSWRAGNQNFDTQFMLKLFTNDLEALHSQGWTLPEGVDADDLLYMECLANEIPAEAEFDAQNPKVYCVRP